MTGERFRLLSFYNREEHMFYYEVKRKEIHVMSEITHLQTTIRLMEDRLLRCKNTVEMEIIQKELQKQRLELQRLEWKLNKRRT